MGHMHISQQGLGAEFLRNVNSFQVIKHFNLKGAELEEEVMGGVFKTVDGPLMPFVSMLVNVMSGAGQKLEEMNKDSLGQVVMELVAQNLNAQQFTEELCKILPVFDDQAKLQDEDGTLKYIP